jgi:FtsP/CotA-like multicopper oxidase with cupredoxin domain
MSGFSMLMRLLRGLVAAGAAASALAADPPEKTFDLALTRGVAPVEQRVLRVGKGDAVRLRLTSDAAGDIHLHGYRLEAKLAPGKPAELAFTAYATGRYRLEWHGAGDDAKTGQHHGPALAILEVRPK